MIGGCENFTSQVGWVIFMDKQKDNFTGISCLLVRGQGLKQKFYVCFEVGKKVILIFWIFIYIVFFIIETLNFDQ